MKSKNSPEYEARFSRSAFIMKKNFSPFILISVHFFRNGMWSSEQCSVNTWWSVVSQPPTQWAHIRLAHMPDIDNDDDKCTMMMMMMLMVMWI